MYAKIVENKVESYPYNIGQLKRENPTISFPNPASDELLAAWNVYKVSFLSAPALDVRTQRVAQNTQPHQESGKWAIGWTIVEKTAEEIQEYDDGTEQGLRDKRDNLLADSDWRVIKAQETGAPMSQAWVDYRQALRDITDHANFPWLDDADWPVKPE